jgi:hypothetical protein
MSTFADENLSISKVKYNMVDIARKVLFPYSIE